MEWFVDILFCQILFSFCGAGGILISHPSIHPSISQGHYCLVEWLKIPLLLIVSHKDKLQTTANSYIQYIPLQCFAMQCKINLFSLIIPWYLWIGVKGNEFNNAYSLSSKWEFAWQEQGFKKDIPCIKKVSHLGTLSLSPMCTSVSFGTEENAASQPSAQSYTVIVWLCSVFN